MLALVRTTAALAASTLLLAACNGMHPGAAASVDGTSITMKSADDLAVTYCEFNALQAQQGGEPVNNAEMRRQAVMTLVSLTVARAVAAEEDLVPTPSSYQIPASQRQADAEQYPGDDEGYFYALELNQELTAIARALGEKTLRTELSEDNQDAVFDAGFQQIDQAAAASDIDIDPRFGLDGTLTQVSSSGSLSVADAEFASNSSLPETQRCE